MKNRFCKTFGHIMLAAIAAASFSTSAAQVSESTNRNPGQLTARTPTLRPLQSPLRLTPAFKMKKQRSIVQLRTTLSQIQQNFRRFEGNAALYEQAIGIMANIQQGCAEKSYSVQDQQQAGCSGSESLDQCMEKLVSYCVDHFERAGIGIGPIQIPGFTTQTLRDAARETATQGRQLSQQTGQYANQAQQSLGNWQ